MNLISQDHSKLLAALKAKLIWIFFSFVLAAIVCGVIYWRTPRVYTAHATFLVFENQADAILNEQLSSVLRLEKLSQRTLLDLVLEILISNRTFYYVAEQMRPEFDSEITRLIQQQQLPTDPIPQLDYINHRLQLKKNIIFFQRFPSSATHIKYTNASPEIALKVVQLHLDYLQLANEELTLTGRKQFIIVLDAPMIEPKRTPDIGTIFSLGFLVVLLFWLSFFASILFAVSLEESSL